jgi:hypothetical protein
VTLFNKPVFRLAVAQHLSHFIPLDAMLACEFSTNSSIQMMPRTFNDDVLGSHSYTEPQLRQGARTGADVSPP